jgi:hypothetical protein
MTEKRRVEIAFSHDFGFYGSKEHFCHFLWGFALPALYEAIQATERSEGPWQFVLEDCGPVMNPVLCDLFALLESEVIIEERSGLSDHTIYAPRWDILAHHQSVAGRDEYSNLTSVLNFRDSPKLHETINAAKFAQTFAAKIHFVRNWILNRFEKANGPTPMNRNSVLVLKRSEEPEYYSPTGGAEIKSYGTTRRTLLNIDSAVNVLMERGHDVVLYEPGAQRIEDQIRTFMQCQRVVGIKGAEFSNLAWMPIGSRMIVIAPDRMKTPPIYQRLGEILGVQYCEISGGDTSTPSLMALVDTVDKALKCR